MAKRALEEEATAAKALHRYVFEAIEAFSCKERSRGCLLVSAATNCGAASTGAQKLLAGYRQASEALIAACIQRGIEDGDMPPASDPDLLAKYFAVLIQGLAAQARDGATADA
ncbi:MULTISPECIES: TetR family transcriptional regulator C-terminal domain-containing protein [Leisingera]|uniref:TetR family transcriptional regulator C-terminal domain-containing protein n=1 Tax=Leisingera TaxID=191028 RepID=UPI001FDFD303|nr:MULTISPECIES: hypothetical protein [Leisingera]